MIKRLFLISVAFALLSAPAFAQDVDFGGVFGAKITKKITRTLNIGLEEEVRLRDNFTSYNRSATTLDLDYTIIPKHLKIGALYAFINDRKGSTDLFGNNHRVAAEIEVRQDIGEFKLSLRGRYQSTFMQEVDKQYKVNPRNVIRAKFAASYTAFGSRWENTLSAEGHYELDPYRGKVNKIRCEGGTEYRLNKDSKLGMGLRVDIPVMEKEPVTIIQLCIAYKFQL